MMTCRSTLVERLTALAVAWFALNSFNCVAEKLTGTVAADGKAVPEVWVAISLFKVGADMAGSRTFCSYFDITQSDANGSFAFDVPRLRQDLHLIAFVPGYVHPSVPIAKSRVEIAMKPMPADVPRRLYYQPFLSLAQCAHRAEDMRRLLPLMRALDQEAEALRLPNVLRQPTYENWIQGMINDAGSPMGIPK